MTTAPGQQAGEEAEDDGPQQHHGGRELEIRDPGPGEDSREREEVRQAGEAAEREEVRQAGEAAERVGQCRVATPGV